MPVGTPGSRSTGPLPLAAPPAAQVVRAEEVVARPDSVTSRTGTCPRTLSARHQSPHLGRGRGGDPIRPITSPLCVPRPRPRGVLLYSPPGRPWTPPDTLSYCDGSSPLDCLCHTRHSRYCWVRRGVDSALPLQSVTPVVRHTEVGPLCRPCPSCYLSFLWHRRP